MINSKFAIATLKSNLASLKKNGEPLMLLSSDVAGVLSAFLIGELSEIEVMDWAEFFDGNEDVEFEPNKMIPDVLFELSSPEINGRLEKRRARELLTLMS